MTSPASPRDIATFDLSAFSDDPPSAPLHLLFIHHSCGGHWLADRGPADGQQCIYRTFPEGGGLRRRLAQAGYQVHEASYGSVVGNDTDIFDWPRKFQQQMQQVLRCKHQDETHPHGVQNQIVAFKSCFPNNALQKDPQVAGADPPPLTIANAQAAYRALLPKFAQHPDVVFVCITPPPLARKLRSPPLWKRAARAALGRAAPLERSPHSGRLARQLNNWLKSNQGWLQDYPARNVVVFDLFDVLTNDGASDFSCYPSDEGYDSHPNRHGHEKATQRFVPFLNRAVRRAGLAQAVAGYTDNAGNSAQA